MAKPGGWNKCVGSGHAYLVLRKGYAEQLAMAHRELGVGYVRFHGIFDDDVGVWKGVKGTYNFTNVKRIYDVVVNAGVKPFVELSFMPATLAMDSRTVPKSALSAFSLRKGISGFGIWNAQKVDLVEL